VSRDGTRFRFRHDAAGRDEWVETPRDDEPTVRARIADDAVEPLRLLEAGRALHPDSAYGNAGLALALLRAGRRAEAAPYQAKTRALLGTRQKGSELDEIYLAMRLRRLSSLDGK